MDLNEVGAFASHRRGRRKPSGCACGRPNRLKQYCCGHGHVDSIAPGVAQGVTRSVLRGAVLTVIIFLTMSTASASRAVMECPEHGDVGLEQFGALFLGEVRRFLGAVAGAAGSPLGRAVLLGLALCAGVMAAVVAVRTCLVGSALLPTMGQSSPAEHARIASEGDAAVNERLLGKEDEFAARLAEALRFKTISFDKGNAEGLTVTLRPKFMPLSMWVAFVRRLQLCLASRVMMPVHATVVLNCSFAPFVHRATLASSIS